MPLSSEDEIAENGMALTPVRNGRWALLTVFFVIGSFVPNTFAAADDPAAAVACGIRSEMKNGLLQLTAIVRSKEPVSGQYNLVVSKDSQSGRSENAQSGAFTLSAEHERVLTTTLLDRGAVGHYRAKLSIKTNAGRVSCSSP
jgi:CsgH protein